MAFGIEPEEVGAEDTAAEFVQRWAEAVIRQASRTRAIRKKAAQDDWAYERCEDWSPEDWQLAANARELWTEEHMLVWSAYQLERWRARLAKERGHSAPPPNEALKLARDALEHLDEAVLGDYAATPPEGGRQKGRALRQLPEAMMTLDAGGSKLFEVLDPEVIDREALAVVASIENELNQQAIDYYTDLMRDR